MKILKNIFNLSIEKNLKKKKQTIKKKNDKFDHYKNYEHSFIKTKQNIKKVKSKPHRCFLCFYKSTGWIQIYIEMQSTSKRVKTILKNNKVARLTLSDFKTHHKATVIKIVWYCCKDNCILIESINSIQK